jgi:2-haloacid dehalogenase
MNRRRLLRALAGVAGAAAISVRDAQNEESQAAGKGIKAIAFDGFVIFDHHSVEKRVVELLPDKGLELAKLWRTRQFEYSWLRTAGDRYVDFWQVIDDALRYSAKSLNVSLSNMQHNALMDAYRNLRPWPDVADGLAQLRRRGIRMAFLSNFTSAMLDTNLKEAGLSEFFEPHMTTDRVRAYKPSPRAYQMGPEGFGLQKSMIAFAAFAPWDAVGAKWFGFPTVWVNRGEVPAEQLDVQPDVIAKDLSGLIEFIGERSLPT